MPNRIQKSANVPSPTALTGPTGTATWFNAKATDTVSIAAGITLLKQSTTGSNIDSDIVLNDVATNIQAGRTSIWNSVDLSSSTVLMTVMFHGADGPSGSRFFVCAGIDSTLITGWAVTLWTTAVKQFANNNGVTTDLISTWTQTGAAFQLQAADLIYNVITALQTNPGAILSANPPVDEPYPATLGTNTKNNTRWPLSLSTLKFIRF